MWQDTGAVFRLYLGDDLQFESVGGVGSGQLGGRWNLWGADRYSIFTVFCFCRFLRDLNFAAACAGDRDGAVDLVGLQGCSHYLRFAKIIFARLQTLFGCKSALIFYVSRNLFSHACRHCLDACICDVSMNFLGRGFRIAEEKKLFRRTWIAVAVGAFVQLVCKNRTILHASVLPPTFFQGAHDGREIEVPRSTDTRRSHVLGHQARGPGRLRGQWSLPFQM